MAQAFLLSTTPADDQTSFNLEPLLDLQHCADMDQFRVHSRTNDPEAADLIIFAEFYGAGLDFERVRTHGLVRRHREKCFVFCANPLVIPFLPGVYSGVEKRWASARTRPGFYLGRSRNPFTTYTAPADDLPYLFSFMGSMRNAAVRAKFRNLHHPRSFFQDTARDFQRIQVRQMTQRERLDYDRRYAELTKASKFVLCPRGLSPSSIRLFETMRMGRVPVILSDAWVPPIGPAWDRFSIQVREGEIASIPRILEEREAEAVEMGELARKEWEQWFSDEVLFHHLVELCLDIRNKRKIPESLGRWAAFLQYLEPFHFRRLVKTAWRGFSRVPARPATAPEVCKQ